ncbi:hypothetical protein QTI66_35655 [Variovorax sp. J22R133]|uniref:hypothetical protein n=1 Tax=Variovorax brevis TaxID=3053503 RepID=UPI0025774B72|nr:hypothetical protein [Variovorax sp. J22R133]MDM0117455.1 hypothetical protein [Variovorax sp. J22R133]
MHDEVSNGLMTWRFDEAAVDPDGLRDRFCHRRETLKSHLAGNKKVRRKASFRFQQECRRARY